MATKHYCGSSTGPRTNMILRRLFPWIAFGVLIALFTPSNGFADDPNDILIVVNKRVKQTKLSTGEIKNIFLKLTTRWKGGAKIIPINAREGTLLRKEFLRAVVNMTGAQEKDYWHDRKIRVGVSKPPEFSHTQKAVFKLKGSIGYVYRSEHKNDVTEVVLVIPAVKKALR